MLILILFAVTNVAAASPRTITKLPKYPGFTFPRPLQISDDEIMIKDLSSFVHNHSQPTGNQTHRNGTLARDGPHRSGPGDRPALRLTPWYIEITNSTFFYSKFLEMMKHCVYSSQDRLKHLTKILVKYQDDVAFRMGFMFDKLDQTLEDMRRIYSYAMRKMHYKRIEEHIYFYKHMTKKNVDVTYIVEFMQTYHEAIMQKLARFNSYFATDIVQRRFLL